MSRELPSGTITMVFSDIEGSTSLLHGLGDAYGDLLAEHHRLLRDAWTEFGGVEVGTGGDSFFVVFERADRALSAVRLAQRSLNAYGWPSGRRVAVRIGVHTGTPNIRNGEYWGSDVHYTARLSAAAHGGQVIVSAATRQLCPEGEFESLGEHALKDFPVAREIFHLVFDGRGADTYPPPRTDTSLNTKLPRPANRLVGRDRELADLHEQVGAGAKLITIVGPGGSGKTRLALEFAGRYEHEFAKVSFVPLDEVDDSHQVPDAIMRALRLPEIEGVPSVDRIVENVSRHRQLVVIDSVEHVIDCAPLIAKWASVGLGVIVVTSQLPLHVEGESVLRLGSLEIPGVEHADPETLGGIAAVDLLLHRVADSGTAFELTPSNARYVAELCRQLEGMPLAIELAASRFNLFEVDELVRRLEISIDSLGRGGRDVPPRQRGLRAVLEWTHGLLDERDQHLLARIAVFSSSFTPELVELAFGDVVEGLATLVDVGLVRRVDRGRLALRPPVQRFALARLAESGEENQARSDVARALAQFCEPYERLWYLNFGESRPRVNLVGANILPSLEWARENDAAAYVRLAAATGWWMNHSFYRVPGKQHVERALEMTTDPVMRARCLQALGTFGLSTSDPDTCLLAAEAWRDIGDADGEAMSLVYAANLYTHRKDGAASLELFPRVRELIPRTSAPIDFEQMAGAVHARSLSFLGNHSQALELLSEIQRTSPDTLWARLSCTTTLADVALEDGQLDIALLNYGEAIAYAADLDVPTVELMQADPIAYALVELGRDDDAARTLAICELRHEELSWPATWIFGDMLQHTASRLTPEQITAGREFASSIGTREGLAWVGALARGAMETDDT
jgi:predicted ATPase/class 3 adenylate cyclase